jgi:ectoine hydroxylase-related dioxygenase (phytanoyl-CoA dioxygenase family)
MAGALRPHRLNVGFDWRGSSEAPRLLGAEQVRQYDEQGFFLYPNAFAPELMDEVAAAIQPFENRTEAFLRAQKDGRHLIARAGEITFTTFLVKLSPACRDFSRHAVFQGICHDLIGPAARLYWDQAVYKKPGAPEEFPWHQDNGYAFLEPQQYLTCWVALNDATEENGCPWVAPGLHRLGTLEHRPTPLGFECLTAPVEGAVAVPAAKGDIVVFSSLTPHRTGPNLTADVRKSYILQYAGDGARVRKGGDEAGVLQDDPERQYLVG